MIAPASKSRDAMHGLTLAVVRDAHSQIIALDYLAGRFGEGSKRGQAIRRARDLCHEIQKFCGGPVAIDQATVLMAAYFSAFDELATRGIGDLELVKALQVALANREARLPASSQSCAADMVRLARLFPGPLLNALAPVPASTFKRYERLPKRRPKLGGAKRHARPK